MKTLVTVVLILSAAACGKDATPLSAPITPVGNSLAVIESNGEHWSNLPDTSLWKILVANDTAVTVGLKRPGSSRGVVKGRPQLSREEWHAGIAALRRLESANVANIDSTHLPVIRVKLRSLQALIALRRLPFVDYVEPSQLEVIYASGCGEDTYGAPMVQIASNDWVPLQLYEGDRMNIVNAWKIADGSGVWLGMTDTGLGTSTSSELDGTHFLSGESAGRTLVTSQSTVSCNHGHRIAALAAGPRNGRGSVGVAYRANLFSVHQANGVIPQTYYAYEAIHHVVTGYSAANVRVVIMAWGLPTSSTAISDEIDYHYYVDDVVFVGAAGTNSNGCITCNTAAFPASKEEVLAATGASHDGTRPGDVYDYGTKSGVVAYTNLITDGFYNRHAKMEGSSGASALVGGAALLVRQAFPQLNRDGVRERLIKTSGTACGAPHVWRDAMINVGAAVGAPCVVGLNGPSLVYTSSPGGAEYTLSLGLTFDHGSFVLGGSGSYSVTVAPRPEISVIGSISDSVNFTAVGKHYRRERKTISFAPAYDGFAYRSEVEVRIVDQVLGTQDVRRMDVLVCLNPAGFCYPTNRSYPTPPPPLTATISGPTTVANGYGYNFSAVASGGSGSYTFSWGPPLPGANTATITGSLCTSGTIEVTVSDGSSSVTAQQYVDVSDTEPPPPGGIFYPCLSDWAGGGSGFALFSPITVRQMTAPHSERGGR